MKLQDWLENMAMNELSNLWIGEEGQNNGFNYENRRKIVSAMNQGLKALSSRFILVQKELILRTYPHITFYYLRTDYAEQSGSNKKTKYIEDKHREPFLGDVIKVLEVWNNKGQSYPINDPSDATSVFTPQFDCLQIPRPDDSPAVSVIYQAYHPMIVDSEDGCRDINLPPFLEEALTDYICGKIYSNMNGADNVAKGADFMQKYENICGEVEAKDLVASSMVPLNPKLEMRGFV